MNQTIRTKKLQEGEIVPITFDYVFTNIFNNSNNMIILENFLSCYLGVDVNKIRGKVEIVNRNLIIEHKKEANKQIDLLVDIEGEKVNIELQNKMSEGIMNRNIVFASKIHAGQLQTGDSKYANIKRTLQINLTRKTNKQLKEKYYFRNEEGKILTEKIEIDLVDMEIAREICYTKDETKLARWCMVFMATKEEELNQALGEDLMENQACNLLKEEIDKYSKDEEVIVMYSEYTKEELERQSVFEEELEREKKKAIEQGMQQGIEQGIEQGIQQGIQQGMEQGERKKQIEIARQMIEDAMPLEHIVKYTKLSIEEIKALKN